MSAALLGAAITGASSILKGIGDVAQGRAQDEAAQYNAQRDEQNAILAEQQAAANEQRFRVLALKNQGSITAAYGASGVAATGSVLDVLGESAANAELDALTIRHNGQIKATNLRNDAAMERWKGGIARKLGYFGGASDLLAGAGKQLDTGLYDGGGSSPSFSSVNGSGGGGSRVALRNRG